ncbi:MAG: hypothetical protein H6Q28_1434, partial [Bacteroidetes bacterium]|nr:hypothetical protein [Bacteroidota bacterium]
PAGTYQVKAEAAAAGLTGVATATFAK